MSNSLRDQLLKSGIAKVAAKPLRKPGKGSTGNKSVRSKAPQSGSGEPDLAHAYALRARSEAREREEARREAELRQQEKKELRRRLHELLEGRSLDQAQAEHARHYEFHGKIRRVYVTADQLEALNSGRLGVVQSGGSFVLVEAEVARSAAAIDAGCVALLVDLDHDNDGADDVPDDLMW